MIDDYSGPYTHRYFVRDLPRFDLVRSHPNYIQIEENIHVIKNFLTEEDLNWFSQLIKDIESKEWDRDDRYWWDKRKYTLSYENANSPTTRRVVHRIRSLINEKELFIRDDLTAIHIINPGEEGMFLHCDNPIYEDYEIDDSQKLHVNLGLQYAIILYLNDFEGGEVYYPNLGLQYKPEKGDALWHPGNKKYTHGVMPVKGNSPRYITTTYITDRKVKKINDKVVGWGK